MEIERWVFLVCVMGSILIGFVIGLAVAMLTLKLRERIRKRKFDDEGEK